MEKYISEDGNVLKFVHDNGAETAVKYLSSCDGKLVESDKISIFISSSVGCPIGCKFCYLTNKKFEYHKLKYYEIVKNFYEVLDNIGDVSDKYLKLSFMGMGDSLTIETWDDGYFKIFDIMHDILKSSINNDNLFKGLYGVDFGTVCPSMKIINYVKFINDFSIENSTFDVMDYAIHPSILKDENRSIIRLFISLHSAVEETRKFLIPNSISLKEIIKNVKKCNNNFNIIFHHMFLDGINDSEKEIDALVNIFTNDLKYFQLRILRYNKCNLSQFEESKKFDNIIKILYDAGIDLKVQISPGSEISAACGQFLCKVVK